MMNFPYKRIFYKFSKVIALNKPLAVKLKK